MSDGYMGSTGDQFAGVDPRELERLRADYQRELYEQAKLKAQAWARVEQLEQALGEIARTWPNAKRSGRRPSLSAEEAQRRADAALHPDQQGGDQ